MKFLRFSILALTVASMFSITSLAATSDTPTRFNTAHYRELQAQYEIAIKNNNTEEQNRLIAEADKLFDAILNQPDGYQSDDIQKQDVFSEYNNYFSFSYWNSRADGTCLTIVPYFSLSWQDIDAPYKAWNILYDTHSSSSHWQNTNSMSKQFLCHVNLAGGWKVPWNLEPWKTNVNPFTCN